MPPRARVVGLECLRLRSQQALDAERTVVVAITSSGLKDAGASRAWLPPVPDAPSDFDGLRGVLREEPMELRCG